MNKGNMNLQDTFLNQIRREGHDASVVLVNGEVLEGAVIGFDNFTVVLSTGGRTRMIYKHAIAHLGPKRALSRAAEQALAAGAGNAERKPSAAAPQVAAGGAASASPEPSAESLAERDARPSRAPAFNPLDLSQVEVGKAAASKA